MENLTFVKVSRDPESLDPVSAAILEVPSTGTSIFDPVVCEIAYRWFCPPGRIVLDPFAGGSIGGIVARVSAVAMSALSFAPSKSPQTLRNCRLRESHGRNGVADRMIVLLQARAEPLVATPK